jgi:RHS repeat-associated protein
VGYTLGYDAENRLNGTYANGQGMSYGYDAQNRRNWIWSGSKDVNGNPTNYTVNVYTPGGQKLAAYSLVSYGTSLAVTLSSSDTYFGSRRLAVMDQLGSVVKATSPVVSYFPWGETKGASNPQDTWNFATYWQDSTTGLDYANNRYYSNIGGRFMTPDPSTAGQDPKAPQSWNLYLYVIGDPVNFSDPTGLFIQCTPPAVPSSDGSTCVSPDPGSGSGGPTTGGSGGGNPGGTTKNHNSGPATCPSGTTRIPNGPCVTQADCIKLAGQQLANQKQLAQEAFFKGYANSVGTTLIATGVLGCTAGAFAGGIAGLIASELLTGTPNGAALGELTCLGGAADAVIVVLPLTALIGAEQGGVQYFSAVSAADNQFQQNIQRCYQSF